MIAEPSWSPAQQPMILERIYREAEKVLIHVWEGKRKGPFSPIPWNLWG